MTPTNEDDCELKTAIQALRDRIGKLPPGRRLNEETTKTSLIVPMLTALGWDPTDPEEVHCEFRRNSRHRPVDYALLLQRTPCMFLEAKPIDQSLENDRTTNQAISYATQAGVRWVVLSNGVDYHVYNAHAPVPLDKKLFMQLSVVNTAIDELVAGLSLLRKAEFTGNRITLAWEAFHVDRQVKAVLEELFSPTHVNALAKILTKRTDSSLKVADIAASLLRASFTVAYPPITTDAKRRSTKSSSQRRKAKAMCKEGTATSDKGRTAPRSLAVQNLIASGALHPNTDLVANTKGVALSAKVTPDGRISLHGSLYDSPSSAASAARLSASGKKSGKPPATNGWDFWKVKHPKTGDLVPLGVLRGES